MEGSGPFNQGHCDCLNRVIQRTAPMLQLAKDCIDCGWDVSTQHAILQEQYDMARKAKQKFFPTAI